MTSETAARLRARMVAALVERGPIVSRDVRDAFATVPRERFVPEVSAGAAYSVHDALITRRDPDGTATSSVSAPWLQAQMLECARLFRGARVLEIGSGGYNAALIAEIVGPEGLVVTVDIDPFVVERAGRFLAETGYPQVKVVLGDAEEAADEHMPEGGFDAIIVTVGVWDCPWGRLLAQGGRMVVPLRFATITRSITFVRDGDRFPGYEPTACGFVSIQGAGAHAAQEARLAGGAVTLTIEGGPTLDPGALERALHAERTEIWTGVTAANGESFDTLGLRIAATDDRYGQIWPDPVLAADLVQSALRWYCPALITPDGFAYLTIREARAGRAARGGKPGWEFGVFAHGADATGLAEQLAAHVHDWDRHWRSHPGPVFTLYPADATIEPPPAGKIFRKRHTQLVMSWP
ncbi:methyltransferase, FxLD system [Nonomuraea sp. NBC_01738]|uniref:methyltransferase, FxLD system n=1 Tax=Nonomuraea sp. NBC_01738 TaxID=2976003 RepID=UPI002E10B8AF|nr:methyltransferase, FxLD system [Nonomuraea sp. NBC_01738]